MPNVGQTIGAPQRTLTSDCPRHIGRTDYRRQWLGWAVTTAVLLLSTTVVAQVGTSSLPSLLAQAGDHVRRFEEAFTLVISDEEYTQSLSTRAFDAPVARRTNSEMLFEWQPKERVWVTVRNVLTLDGHVVQGSQGRLSDALDQTGALRTNRLRRILDDNARFNLGRTVRTFNYPTLVLSFLDPALQPRFTFVLAGRERIGPDDTWKVTFTEHARPTLIQGDGLDRVSRGIVWLRQSDGLPIKTRLDLSMRRDDANSYATVEVEYARNPKLDMWVPVRMREHHMEIRLGRIEETLHAEASYREFRRFETSSRIVAPVR